MHHRAAFSIGVVALLLIAPVAARGGEFKPEKLAPLRAKMQTFVDNNTVAGVVAVIGSSKGVAAIEAIGQRTYEPAAAMEKDTLFRIASMTKPIVGLAVMQLVEQGKLSIDDPVEKHLPEFQGQLWQLAQSGDLTVLKKPARPITVKDLLTHTSGMPGNPAGGLTGLYFRRDRTLGEAVAAFSQKPLEFEPGTKWSYCNTGIDTLGRIIEVLSGQSCEAYMNDRIFAPLGMKDTAFYPTSDQLARESATFDLKDGKLVQNNGNLIGLPTGAKYPIPAGGLHSTGPDLAKLYQCLLAGGALGEVRIVKPETIAVMTSVHTGELVCGFTPGTGWGLGCCVIRQPQGPTAMLSPGAYGHGGAFATQGWLDPAKDLFVILLIQRNGLPNGDGSDLRVALQTIAVEAQK